MLSHCQWLGVTWKTTTPGNLSRVLRWRYWVSGILTHMTLSQPGGCFLRGGGITITWMKWSWPVRRKTKDDAEGREGGQNRNRREEKRGGGWEQNAAVEATVTAHVSLHPRLNLTPVIKDFHGGERYEQAESVKFTCVEPNARCFGLEQSTEWTNQRGIIRRAFGAFRQDTSCTVARFLFLKSYFRHSFQHSFTSSSPKSFLCGLFYVPISDEHTRTITPRHTNVLIYSPRMRIRVTLGASAFLLSLVFLLLLCTWRLLNATICSRVLISGITLVVGYIDILSKNRLLKPRTIDRYESA